MTYEEVEEIAKKQLEECAGYVLPYYKKHVIAMKCNTVMMAEPKSKIIVEDMIWGMCHIFTFGEDNQIEKEL